MKKNRIAAAAEEWKAGKTEEVDETLRGLYMSV
jgi:hypothetical protein